MPRVHFAALPALLYLALSAAGCASPAPNGGAVQDSSAIGAIRLPSLTGTDWICTELIDPEGISVPLADQPPTLVIVADGKTSGFAGVNRYFSEATFGNSISAVTPLKFGPIAATRMAGPPECMKLEGAFTSMLERVRSAEVIARSGIAARPTLLLSDGDRILARFTPGAPSR